MCPGLGPAAVSGLSDGSSSWAAVTVPRAAESGRLGRTGKRVCRLVGEPEPQAEQNFKLKPILSWSPV